jgi:2-polyprenyl-3-methyl-5-hydroxy-6-metoxy-1,4-benzoquinol methylase
MQELKQRLTTEEELFCTKYELEILSGILNQGSLERWLPGFCSPHTHNEHVARYEWVKDFVKDKIVLDVACGTGFGSYMLAQEGDAAKVIGWDIDEKTIRYASLRNKHPNLVFEADNAETFDVNKEYDVIVSFETIEHLEKPGTFLRNIDRALTLNGICFISTPISAMPENNHPDNIYHQREWGFRKFQEFAKGYLKIEEVYLQLYNEQKTNMGYFSKVLQKAGLKHNDQPPAIEKLTPQKWDRKQLKEESIGTEWTGYQILHCSKKTDAGT